MCFKKNIILFFITILICESSFAQQVPDKKDSTHLYENIGSYSKRNKVTLFLYKLIFKPIADNSPKKKTKKKVYQKLIKKPYGNYEGKIIRNINIETLDPFGFLIADMVVVPQNFLSVNGNKLHIKSRHIAIRNLLLIRQNQKFDSLLVKESERLVRSREYVNDVLFIFRITSKNSDSVDIFIREIDKWSIIPALSISTSSTKVGLTDNNFLGLGQEFQIGFARNFTTEINAYNTNYSIPNIRNTYIGTTLLYEIDGYKNFKRSLAFDRPFYSPFARWAGGVSFASQAKIDSLGDLNSVNIPVDLKFGTQDYWAGNALRIFKGNSEKERVTNFILTMRFLRIRYFEKPIASLDTLHIYSDENFYLTGIGISTRQYVQDKYIFKYGVTEDVPVGKVYGLTGGYQVKNDVRRLYLGARISIGYYYPWGYFSPNFEYGTFFRKSVTEQGVFTAGVNYFSGLFEIGRWKFRQFVKPQITLGLNRFASDSLNLNDGYGLDGFNSPTLSGINRMVFTLQTQSYTPWDLIGFRFGPYLLFSLGMLSNAVTGFKNSKLYSQIGFGVLIKNENLVISTFQFSISFYPVIPGYGDNVFKINPFKTTDFGFRDFEIGKPGTVSFQ